MEHNLLVTKRKHREENNKYQTNVRKECSKGYNTNKC